MFQSRKTGSYDQAMRWKTEKYPCWKDGRYIRICSYLSGMTVISSLFGLLWQMSQKEAATYKKSSWE